MRSTKRRATTTIPKTRTSSFSPACRQRTSSRPIPRRAADPREPEYPNIAALVDGGVTVDGQPYFIMEYVDGKPITHWCDEKRLTVRERTELIPPGLRSIESAHRSLSWHRDLKPGNILVTDDGRVKLLDFGIARLMRHHRW